MATVREEIKAKIAELEAELKAGEAWLEKEAHTVRQFVHNLFSKPVTVIQSVDPTAPNYVAPQQVAQMADAAAETAAADKSNSKP